MKLFKSLFLALFATFFSLSISAQSLQYDGYDCVTSATVDGITFTLVALPHGQCSVSNYIGDATFFYDYFIMVSENIQSASYDYDVEYHFDYESFSRVESVVGYGGSNSLTIKPSTDLYDFGTFSLRGEFIGPDYEAADLPFNVSLTVTRK